MPKSAQTLLAALAAESNPEDAIKLSRFFKAGPGEYGENDRLLGLRMPQQHQLAKQFVDMPAAELGIVLQSPWHEARMTAALIVLQHYQRCKKARQMDLAAEWIEFLIAQRQALNNWDLVDIIIPKTLGEASLDDSHLVETLRSWLVSTHLWERRMAMLATFAWIRVHDFSLPLEFATALKNDSEDLMHKAVGWMLREMGKRDPLPLHHFLEQYAATLPRTLLRYAIEKLSPEQRQDYLGRAKQARN